VLAFPSPVTGLIRERLKRSAIHGVTCHELRLVNCSPAMRSPLSQHPINVQFFERRILIKEAHFQRGQLVVVKPPVGCPFG
jgi:hypothetical protein